MGLLLRDPKRRNNRIFTSFFIFPALWFSGVDSKSLRHLTVDICAEISAVETKFRLLKLQKFQSSPQSPTPEGEEDSESVVQALKIPDEWLLPSKAIEESEWLRVTLHKWLDDEYCPEPTNVEISQVAAKSFYSLLLENETDMGVILLKMAQDLTSISYQESFHGAFTSANAAINLIVEKVETGLL